MSSLTKLRYDYFNKIAKSIASQDAQFIIVTHILFDRPEFLQAIKSIANISLIVAIPYSLNQQAYQNLNSIYPIITPTLEELSNPEYLLKNTVPKLDLAKPVIILEIGGYYAQVIKRLVKEFNVNLLGVVEDTEIGHREYEKLDHKNFPCPVISVARSSLKRAEDFLIGQACLFSTEKLVRQTGFLIDGKSVLVTGFGKIGRGAAHALARRRCHVSVYDIDPAKRIEAISEGFLIPDKKETLKKADMIFGTTGKQSINAEDFKYIKNGALLVSCSSKNVEFDLTYLKANYTATPVFEHYVKYENENNFVYLLADGRPINFLDGSALGPVLALVQSEIIFAINEVITLNNEGKRGLFELSHKGRTILADEWIKHFCNPITGHYS